MAFEMRRQKIQKSTLPVLLNTIVFQLLNKRHTSYLKEGEKGVRVTKKRATSNSIKRLRFTKKRGYE